MNLLGRIFGKKREIVVHQWQIGLLIEHGTVIEELDAGIYKVPANQTKKQIIIYDTRETISYTPSYELRTNDEMSIILKAKIPRKIVSPKKLVSSVSDNEYSIYNWVESITAPLVSDLSVQEAMASTQKIQKNLEKHLKPKAKEIGIDLCGNIVVNISVPRSLRKAFEAEVIARKKALAELEEARGKTAVLRHLNNASTMISKNPDLYKLLVSQKVRSLNINIDDTKK